MLIDSHCHIQFNAYKDDGDEVIKRALENNVWMIAVGSQASTSERGVQYASRYPTGVWAAVGLHPVHLTSQEIDEQEIKFHSREEKFDYDFYKKLASRPRVVAIGETGFDFYHLSKNPPFKEIQKRQTETFQSHCELADELNLPLTLHCREAHHVLLPILKKYILAGKLRSGGAAHCFGGDWPTAKKYLDIGFYLGFTGIITFLPKANPPPRPRVRLAEGGLAGNPRAVAKKSFETLWEVVKKTPLEQILIETDAPYLSPEPFRGQRNEPANVRQVAKKIAELKQLSLEEVEEQTFKNTLNLFKKIK